MITYIPKKPCKRGHMLRYKDRSCVICRYEAGKKFRLENPDKCREYLRKYRHKDPDKYNILIKTWNLRNPGKATVATQRWFAKNPGYVSAAAAKRRAMAKNQTPAWLTPMDKFEINCIYSYCSSLRAIGLDYHVDHIVPLRGKQVSGFHVSWNLQVIRAEENHRKNNKYEEGKNSGRVSAGTGFSEKTTKAVAA